jgi:hypothetical protein
VWKFSLSFSYIGRDEVWGRESGICPDANVLAIIGPGTAWGSGDDRPMSLKDVPASTILAAECRESGIPWAAPGDFEIHTMPHVINGADGKGISSRFPGGFHVLFADGKVWFLSNSVPFETLSQFFTVEGAAKHDRERLLAPYIATDDPETDGWHVPGGK